jgi:tetratricopeptide (TPR) repeat protein
VKRVALASFLTVAAALLATSGALAHDGTCKTSSPSEATLAAGNALEQDPRDLDARLRFADALMSDNCFEDAVKALEAGEAIHGRNAKLQSELREARSILREQGYFEDLNRAEESAKLSRHLLRCNRLADIEACDQALALKPDDPQVVIAKADALVQANRPAEALMIYERARELAPDDVSVGQKIAAADAKRREALTACINTAGQTALQSCQSSLAPGGEDEFAIRKRIGTLLQSANQPSAALDSYIAASLLKPGDRSIALSIVTLSESTSRKDALTLSARGSALLTLGRALDALRPLKQALALSPDLPGAKAQLAKAERLAQDEARKLMRADRVAQEKDRRQAAAAVANNEAPAPQPSSPPRRYSNTAPVTKSN